MRRAFVSSSRNYRTLPTTIFTHYFHLVHVINLVILNKQVNCEFTSILLEIVVEIQNVSKATATYILVDCPRPPNNTNNQLIRILFPIVYTYRTSKRPHVRACPVNFPFGSRQMASVAIAARQIGILY